MEAIASADGTSHQREPRRARSNVHSDNGSNAEIGASRWPAAVCSSRYGATSNASPPTSAAPTPSSSSLSQAYVSSPAAISPSSTKTFQPTTTPSALQSGQKGRPKGQADGLSCGSAMGRNEYGSRQG